MRRFILTGTPGSGKTALIRQLELQGFGVVEEAATDLIAAAQASGVDEAWREPGFIGAIAELQMARVRRAASLPDDIQFHDRSVVCTAALAAYLGHPVPEIVERELERVRAEAVFERQVFFVRNLGFVARTEARRISFEEALRFERVHEDTYRGFGFELVFVEAGTVTERVEAVLGSVRGFAAD